MVMPDPTAVTPKHKQLWWQHPPFVASGLEGVQEVIQGIDQLLLPPSHDEVTIVVQNIDHGVLHNPGFP